MGVENRLPMTERSKQKLWLIILLLLGQLERFRTSKHGLILCLHRVAPAPVQAFQPTAELAITPKFLDRMLGYLRRRDIDVVSLGEALERSRAGDPAPFVSFTFDDGYRDNFDAAFPIFLRHRAPFAIFLTTGFLDGTRLMWWAALESAIVDSNSVELPDGQLVPTRTVRQKYQAYVAGNNWFRQALPSEAALAVRRLLDQHPESVVRFETASAALSWDMVRRMATSGLVTFGCHTVSHPTLSRLDSATITEEIVQSRDRIADELGGPPLFFAYPYGSAADIGGLAAMLVAEHGFEAAFTTSGSRIERNDLSRLFAFPRITWNGYHQWLGILHAHSSGLPFTLRHRWAGGRGSVLRLTDVDRC
jgi:peptidoglycan/xylan/chitin deacetylase (PgdA/CDA1 family)